jgi:aminocarboxymuconate-semialdehyde decarboxylase
MPNRRQFFRMAGAAAGSVFLANPFLGAQSPARRQLSIAGRRVRVIDVHAHCVVPVEHLTKGTNLDGGGAPAGIIGPMRVAQMDKAGIDVQVLSITPWWNAADRDLSARIVAAQNEGIAKYAAAFPGRFVGLATVSMRFPDLAAQQLEDAVKRLGMRGASMAGHVNGENVSDPKYDPFWAKAAALGVPVFVHPAGAENLLKDNVLDGRGDLGNIIGNPLETTHFLSRLIFDGMLDRHPNLRIIAAHGGGYLPSYLARTDVACKVRGNAKCANTKDPREYFRGQILADSMVFTEEGLRHLDAEMGVGQVVYGTDIPFTWPDTLDVILNAPFLNNAEKEQILGGNLMKLLRITS